MANSSQKKHLLSDLYPYDITGKKNADLRKGLREFSCLISALAEASYHFQNGNLEKFDALVGENACQIRAIKIAIMASKGGVDFHDLDAQIAKAQETVGKLLEEKKIAKLMIDDVLLSDMLVEQNLRIELSYEQWFVFQCFLLCEMKELCATGLVVDSLTTKDKVARKLLKKFNQDISSHFTRGLVDKVRKNLANASVNFVRKSALRTGEESLINILSEEFTIEHNSLPCLPMFWTYKALLEAAKKDAIPLIIHAQFLVENDLGFKIVDEEILYFNPVSEDGLIKYSEMEVFDMDSEKPACVVQGMVKLASKENGFCKTAWKNQMTKNCITSVILAGAADHRQYPNPSICPEQDCKEYDSYKKLAIENGFSLENPHGFFINHVFPIQVKNAPTLLKCS